MPVPQENSSCVERAGAPVLENGARCEFKQRIISRKLVMIGQSVTAKDNLYEEDFYLWIKATAQKLKEGKFNQIDVPNLVEEIESMGRSEKRELKNRLIVLLMHLLKWEYQPEKRSQSWRSTIAEQRICIEALLEDSPSLQPLILEVFDNCYEKACQKAAEETGIKLNFFPKESPFTLESALKVSFFDE